MDFVLIHGSGAGAWAWDGVRPLLEQAGHRVHCPSLSGMGEAETTFFGQITQRFVDPLLDAAGVRPGARVLDVASGPGYVTARAAERGAPWWAWT